jgi:hypothetical protein
MSNTFVFRLENGHYYIGAGDDVVGCFHGLMKTLPNKPIGIERIIENGSIEQLIYLTKSYYGLYGKDKVRSPIMLDWVPTEELETSRKQSLLLSQTNKSVNIGDSKNMTVLDYMIYLKNSNLVCRRRCTCINRICPQLDTESD